MPEKNVESAWLVRFQKDGFGCFFLPMNGTADSSVEFPAVSLNVCSGRRGSDIDCNKIVD